MSIFRSLSSILSSAIDSTPPPTTILHAATRSFSLTSSAAADNHQRRDSGGDAPTTVPSKQQHQQQRQQQHHNAERHHHDVVMEEKSADVVSTMNGAAAETTGASGVAVVEGLPEIDLSHLSETERQQIVTVMARAYGLDETTTSIRKPVDTIRTSGDNIVTSACLPYDKVQEVLPPAAAVADDTAPISCTPPAPLFTAESVSDVTCPAPASGQRLCRQVDQPIENGDTDETSDSAVAKYQPEEASVSDVTLVTTEVQPRQDNVVVELSSTGSANKTPAPDQANRKSLDNHRQNHVQHTKVDQKHDIDEPNRQRTAPLPDKLTTADQKLSDSDVSIGQLTDAVEITSGNFSSSQNVTYPADTEGPSDRNLQASLDDVLESLAAELLSVTSVSSQSKSPPKSHFTTTTTTTTATATTTLTKVAATATMSTISSTAVSDKRRQRRQNQSASEKRQEVTSPDVDLQNADVTNEPDNADDNTDFDWRNVTLHIDEESDTLSSVQRSYSSSEQVAATAAVARSPPVRYNASSKSPPTTSSRQQPQQRYHGSVGGDRIGTGSASSSVAAVTAVTTVPPMSAWLSPRNVAGSQHHSTSPTGGSSTSGAIKVVDPMFSAAYSRLEGYAQSGRQRRGMPSPSLSLSRDCSPAHTTSRFNRHYHHHHLPAQQQRQCVTAAEIYSSPRCSLHPAMSNSGHVTDPLTLQARRRRLTSRSMEMLDRIQDQTSSVSGLYGDHHHDLVPLAAFVGRGYGGIRGSGSTLSLSSDASSWEDNDWYSAGSGTGASYGYPRWDTTSEKLRRLQVEIDERRQRLHHLLRRAQSFDQHQQQYYYFPQQQQQQPELTLYDGQPAGLRYMLIDTPSNKSVFLRRPSRCSSATAARQSLSRSHRQQYRSAGYGSGSGLCRSVSLCADPGAFGSGNANWRYHADRSSAANSATYGNSFGRYYHQDLARNSRTADQQRPELFDDNPFRKPTPPAATYRRGSGSQLSVKSTSGTGRRRDDVLDNWTTAKTPSSEMAATSGGKRIIHSSEYRVDTKLLAGRRQSFESSPYVTTSAFNRPFGSELSDCNGKSTSTTTTSNNFTREEYKSVVKQSDVENMRIHENVPVTSFDGKPDALHKFPTTRQERLSQGEASDVSRRVSGSSAVSMTSSSAADDVIQQKSTPKKRPKNHFHAGDIEMSLTYFGNGCSGDGDTLCVRVLQAVIQVSTSASNNTSSSSSSPSPTVNPVARVTLQLPLTASRGGPMQRQQSTACALGTVNPTWRQTLVFHNPPCRHDWPSTSLHVTVWDRDKFQPDRLIGEVTISLDDGSMLDGQARWYRLRMRRAVSEQRSRPTSQYDNVDDDDIGGGSGGNQPGNTGTGNGSKGGADSRSRSQQSSNPKQPESSSSLRQPNQRRNDVSQKSNDDVSLTKLNHQVTTKSAFLTYGSNKRTPTADKTVNVGPKRSRYYWHARLAPFCRRSSAALDQQSNVNLSTARSATEKKSQRLHVRLVTALRRNSRPTPPTPSSSYPNPRQPLIPANECQPDKNPMPNGSTARMKQNDDIISYRIPNVDVKESGVDTTATNMSTSLSAVSDDMYSLWLAPGENGLRCRENQRNTALGPGQILPSSVSPSTPSPDELLSYYVVADLLMALRLDSVPPSTLTVSVEQCTNIWDRLLALYQRREWYVKLYIRSYSEGLKRVQKEKTQKRTCQPDAVFSQVFRCQTECQNDLLEASLCVSRQGLFGSSREVGQAVISIARLTSIMTSLQEQCNGEKCQLVGEYKLLAEHRSTFPVNGRLSTQL